MTKFAVEIRPFDLRGIGRELLRRVVGVPLRARRRLMMTDTYADDPGQTSSRGPRRAGNWAPTVVAPRAGRGDGPLRRIYGGHMESEPSADRKSRNDGRLSRV
jgi:hypothetical protein